MLIKTFALYNLGMFCGEAALHEHERNTEKLITFLGRNNTDINIKFITQSGEKYITISIFYEDLTQVGSQ